MHTRSQIQCAPDILIAEDDAVTRMALREALEDEGYRCAEADNGMEAVQIADQCSPRLVLLDVMMPGVDGFAAAKQLRTKPETRNIPILFLTGRDDRLAHETARHFRPETLLTKPIDRDGLIDVVAVVLNSAESARRFDQPHSVFHSPGHQTCACGKEHQP